MRYTPEPTPGSVDPKELLEYVQRELANISTSIGEIVEGTHEVCTKAPPRPREGMLRYADGTVWDPAGAGPGFVLYDGANWIAVSSGGGGDAAYTHTQGVASAVWTVVHNLAKYPSVTVVDSAYTEVEGDVVHDSLNQCTITFSAAFSGRAFCN